MVLTCALTDGRSELLLPVVLGHGGAGRRGRRGARRLVNRLRIEPLILTFGTLSVLQGAIFAYTDRSVGRAPAELALAGQRAGCSGMPVAGLVLLGVRRVRAPAC